MTNQQQAIDGIKHMMATTPYEKIEIREGALPDDGNGPITREWLKATGVQDRIVIDNYNSDMQDNADVILISPDRIELATTSGASGFNYRATIPLPHIQTRSQLLALIRLLAPDWKAGT